jgi:enamine deaminase RidA (YjgF/YER057c/UK114 family)
VCKIAYASSVHHRQEDSTMRTQCTRGQLYALIFTALMLLAASPLMWAQRRAGKAMRPGEKQHLNPPGISTPTGYTHVVTAQPGRIVYIAGQVSLNEKGEVVGKGDLRAQTAQVFGNLTTALQAAGATWNDVVKMNTYIVNYSADVLPALRETRNKYITGPNPPASTLVGVQALARPDFLIEIEAVAVIP